MRKRAREDPCGICNHYHNYEQGEVCPNCGHRLPLSAAVSASPPAVSPDRDSWSNASSSRLLTIPGASDTPYLNVELSGKDCASERSTDSIAKRDTSEVALGRRVLSEVSKTNEVVSNPNNEYVSSPEALSPRATTSSSLNVEDFILRAKQGHLDRLWDIVSNKLSETSLEHIYLIKQGVNEIIDEMGRFDSLQAASLRAKVDDYFTFAEIYTKRSAEGSPWNFFGGKEKELVSITEQEAKNMTTLADSEKKLLDLEKEQATVKKLIATTELQQLQVQAKKLAIEEEISAMKSKEEKDHAIFLAKLKKALENDLQDITSIKLSHSVR